MDAQRFDHLTRALARATTRRGVLRGVAVALAGGLAGTRRADAAPACRGAGHPCEGNQVCCDGLVCQPSGRGAANRCTPQALPTGTPCSQPSDCASHFCVDGVCCDGPCTGQCESCASGACLPITGAPVGGRPACPGSGPCQSSCDGSTRQMCAGFPGAETPCGDPTCAGGWQTTYACGGNGTCTPTTASCGLYTCGANGCLTTCNRQGDCVDGASCANGVCQQLDSCTGVNCDDGDPCTIDECRDGTCTHTPIAGCCTAPDQCPTPNDPCLVAACEANSCTTADASNGTACPGTDRCFQTYTCQGGTCTGTDPVVCQASDQCHQIGECDSATGQCTAPPVRDGTGCDDGDLCTLGETCQAGICTGGKPVVCKEPKIPCFQRPTCDPTTGGCPEPELAAGWCYIDDTCVTAGTSPKKHPCQICDPKQSTSSWSTVADGTRCSDHNACTDTDTCQQGVCTPGTAVVCHAQDQCHEAGVCDPSTGKCTNPVTPDSTACDDLDPCTINDVCHAGVCAGTKRDCSSLDSACTAGVCNPQTGACEAAAIHEGEPCESGDLCTEGSICQDGVCAGGEPVTCQPTDICSTALCVPESGCVSTPGNNGSSCGQSQYCFDGDCETCRVGGKECESSAQCCSGVCLLDGHCQCKPFGGDCDADNDCCVGVCIDGSCGCAGQGEACAASDNCCSFACSEDGVCGCARTGLICQEAEDCCNGLCEGGECRCREPRAACSSDENCCTGPCENGFCRCLADDEACESDTNCCSGFCYDGTCSCRYAGLTCSADYDCCLHKCVDGVCGCRDLFEDCDSGHDCCTGLCSFPGNFCTCTTLGGLCTVDYQCCGIQPGCCGGACVEMDSNLDHCGACGNECAVGEEICSYGHCCPVGQGWDRTRCCPIGYEEWDGICCPIGSSPSNGICCLFGLENCNGSCVSLEFDPNNCGECGRHVPPGAGCFGGEPGCPPGSHYDNGLCCVDGLHNSNGICCASGWSNCGGRCVDQDIDPLNCGSCGYTCESFPFICIDGECI